MDTGTLFLNCISAYLTGRSPALPADCDWDALLSLSREQKLTAPVYSVVASRAANRAEWRTAAMLDVTRQAQRTAAFLRLYRELAERSLQPLVVKGILCRETFPEPDARISSDEDLYVPRADYPRFHQTMLALGFTAENPDMDSAHELRYYRGGLMVEGNCELLRAVSELHPAAIFTVGDMVNAGADDAEVHQMVAFVSRLQEIAQVYFSLGNTELQNMMDGGADILRLVREVGAVAMLDDYVEAEIGGNRVNVGFTMGHYNYTRAQWNNPPDYAMEYAVGADGTPAIVLRHMPESFISDIHDKWTADLYLCGHTHGGIWRIPGIGGVFAPTQGFWPKYDRGYFTFDEGKYQMIISPGLAGHDWIPRLFNMPEISVIHLTGSGNA